MIGFRFTVQVWECWVNKLPSHCIANLGSFALDDSMPKIAEDFQRLPKIAFCQALRQPWRF
jgi:hypothetical protein